jgi:hypothetical protein
VRSEARGTICVGRDGLRVLDDATVQGRDPLATYGEHAATGLRHVDAMATCPDILVISMYDAESDEVAAFEELIGSHGGLGGAQTRPFLLAPANWPLDDAPLVGAPAIHRQLRTWLEEQLHIAFPPGDDPLWHHSPSEQVEGNLDVGALPEHRDGQRGLPVG